MPTQYRYRHYCKGCEDFTLFIRDDFGTKELTCTTCDKLYETVKIGEIAQEKLDAQRARFKQKRSQQISQYLNTYTSGGMIAELLRNESRIGIEVKESDAGLLTIEKWEKEERELAKQQRNEEIARIRVQFKDVQRNESCRCGSGIKYKKCCMNSVQYAL
jgi:SEC-C motif